MKQIILSLIAMCSAFAAQAQSCVSVQQVSTNYANKQITFDLKWGMCNNTNHLYRVWVFVDYRPVTNVMKGAWGRAAITATDKGTLVSANNGVWITGSANATQRVTLTLNVVGNKFDWCAFASDCPPNALLENGAYTLRGTPPFTVDGVQLDNARKTYPAGTYCMSSITDATGNPGGFINNLGCTCPAIQPGAVGFTSSKMWVVGSQTWSAPVTATYCNKTSYSDGSSGAYKNDCRTNLSGYDGHLFSWCMVAKFAATLCPNGWRVPTVDDFCTLDKNLNNRSNCLNRTDATALSRYLNTWDGRYGGRVHSESLIGHVYLGYYWSQSEHNADIGYRLRLYVNNEVQPLSTMSKNDGYPLRCVK